MSVYQSFMPWHVALKPLSLMRLKPFEYRVWSIIINTSYLTDSYIVFTLKMESISKNTIFGLKMMVKSGLEKNILKSLHAVR